MTIDVNFDFQAAMGDPDKDADKYSKTLQEYHRVLWSKKLPDGRMFNLEKLSNSCLLRYSFGEEQYLLSSDRAVATFSRWVRLQHLTSQIPHEMMEEFIHTSETIGGIIIWPSTMIDGKRTINAERGFNRKICDRLDLTIECIRLYYRGENSPLFETLKRYSYFFNLFQDFEGYINFFLFQDFVSNDYEKTVISQPFDGFKSPPVPLTLEEYFLYIDTTMQLINARNSRIADFAARQTSLQK